MQSNDPDNDSGNSNNPNNQADEPTKSEGPYIAPDGREHIIEKGDEEDNSKSA